LSKNITLFQLHRQWKSST